MNTMVLVLLSLAGLRNISEIKMTPWYKKLLYILVAPFIIGAWCVMNPRRVWAQAKKDFGVEE